MEWRPRRLAACALLLPAVARAASPTVQWAAEATYTQCSQGTIGLTLPDSLKSKRSNDTADGVMQHRWSIRVYNIGVPQDKGAVGPALTASISTPHPSSLATEAALPLKTTLKSKSSSTTSTTTLPSSSSSSSSTSSSTSDEPSSSSEEEWIEPSSSASPEPSSSASPSSTLPSSSSSPTPAVHRLPIPQPKTTEAPKPQTSQAPPPKPTSNGNNQGNTKPNPPPTTTSKGNDFGIGGYGGLSLGTDGIEHSGGLGVEIGGKTYGLDHSGGIHWKRLEPRAVQLPNINKTVIEDFTGDTYNWTVNVPTGNYRLAAYDAQTGILSNSQIFAVVDGGTSCMTAADWGDLPTGLSTGAIAGLVIGLIAGLLILGGVSYILRRRRRAGDRKHLGHGHGQFWRVHSNHSVESFGNLGAGGRSFKVPRPQDAYWDDPTGMSAQYELNEKGNHYYAGNTPPLPSHGFRPPRPPLPDLPPPTQRSDSPWDSDTIATSHRRFSGDLSTHTGTSHWPPASIHSGQRSFMGGAMLQPTVTGHSIAATAHSIAATAGSFQDRLPPTFMDVRGGVRSVAMSAVSSMATAGDREPPVLPVSPDNTGDTVDMLDINSAYGGIDSTGGGYSHMERASRPDMPAWVPQTLSATACKPLSDESHTPGSPGPSTLGPRLLAGPTAPLQPKPPSPDRARGPSRSGARPDPGHAGHAGPAGHAREDSEGSGETTSTTTAHIQKAINNLQQQHRNDTDNDVALNFPNTYSFLDHPYLMPNAPGDRVSNPLSQMWSPSDGGHSDWSHWGRKTDEA